MTQYSSALYCTTEAQKQIARLMYEIGKSSDLDVQYGTNGTTESGAYAKNVIRTLEHIGFSSGGTLYNYNTSRVVQELLKGYNVLVSGVASDEDAHQWLCHGIMERKRDVKGYSSDGILVEIKTESQWYILCNWGWQGLCDGYYLSTVFDPDSGAAYPENTDNSKAAVATRAGYSNNVQAITGIRR